MMVVLFATLVAALPTAFGFQGRAPTASAATKLRSSSSLDEMFDKNDDLLLARRTLEEQFPNFSKLLNLNDSVWKSIGAGYANGFTIFAPTNEALESMDVTKQGQLFDERNLETSQKIAAFHVIDEKVTAEDLFNCGGVVTLGGEIPVDRSKSGGMFGMGGQEDGGVLVNQVKVLKSVPLGSGIVHLVDGLISPNILWRYMDQLRIPGSN